MTDKIHLTVAVVCKKGNKFLMVSEISNQRLVINQPAGHVEPGESFTTAALREAYEETGYNLTLTSLLGLSCLTGSNGKTYHRISFAASCENQQPNSKIDPDINDVLWLTAEEIFQRQDHRSKLVIKDLQRYIDGAFYPLTMLSEE